MSVLLLQMARAEDVEDLGDLNGARPEAEVNPVLPRLRSTRPCAQKPWRAPPLGLCPLCPVKVPCQPLRRWWRTPPKAVAKLAAEDPMAAAGPSQVA
jgi:hypothetical protein